MKKLSLFLVSLLLSLAAFSQTSSPSAVGLVVENKTICTQYYLVFGDEDCECGSNFTSPFIAIPPGATHYYPSSTTLGGTFPTSTPKGIVGVKTLDGPVLCGAGGGMVGQTLCGLIQSYGFTALTSSCTPCASTKAAWFSATSCSDKATLIFYS